MKRILISITYLFYMTPGLAQIDTSIVMEDILIKTQSIRYESLRPEKNLSQNDGSLVNALESKNNLYIKNYGTGSLSTLSIRGGSAGQSLVLWNGLPLQSPMLGLLDLSLIPSNITEAAKLNKGGSSTLWGSGAVSGVLNLQSASPKDYTVENKTSIGSFGYINQNTSIHLKGKKWNAVTKYIHEASNRDFEYNATPQITIQQTNAAFKRNHLTQDFYYNLNAKDVLSAHLWLYEASTMIPPTTVQNISTAFQDDSALRTNLSWKHISESWISNVRLGFFVDNNDFFDPSILLEALNDFSSSFADVNVQHQKENHIFSIGGTASYTKARSDGYQGSRDEQKIALFSQYKLDLAHFIFKASIRQELVDDNLVPFLPNIEISYLPNDALSTYVRISRDFRYPTLNDRFWIPGGNEDLLPENGWSGELGLRIKKDITKFSYGYTITGFYRDIEDWILWSPGDNVPFWTSQNINNVISKGIEQSLDLAFISDPIKITFEAKYDYISSTFQSALTLPMVNAGDQLLYIPKHNFTSAIHLNVNQWAIKYNHRISGSSRGVNEDLRAFQTGDTSITYRSKYKNINYSIFTAIHNLWDESYFIIERRPMAGRNFSLGFSFKY